MDSLSKERERILLIYDKCDEDGKLLLLRIMRLATHCDRLFDYTAEEMKKGTLDRKKIAAAVEAVEKELGLCSIEEYLRMELKQRGNGYA